MNLLLLTFGDRAENHHQAAFCILSFLKDPRIGRVLVMTDRPGFYRWLQAGVATWQEGEKRAADEGRERSTASTQGTTSTRGTTSTQGVASTQGSASTQEVAHAQEVVHAQAVDQPAGVASPVIEVLPISADTLKDWQGTQQFFWRIKIKAIEHALQRHPDQHLVYVDSDTFLATDLSVLNAGLDAGQAFMHCRENALADRNSRTLTQMRRTLVGQTLAGVTFDGRTEMWNAGVIALPASRGRALVDHALQLCDAMCASTCPRRLIEQLAFSVALKGSHGPQPAMIASQTPGAPAAAYGMQHAHGTQQAHGAREVHGSVQVTGEAGHAPSLQPCDRWIVHYWGNKPGWNVFIGHFLAESRLRNETVAQAVARAANTDWQHLPTEDRHRSTAERLKRLVDRLWPRYRVRYFTPD